MVVLMIVVFLLGCFMGMFAIIGQILGLLAYSEARKGHEGSRHALAFAIGTIVGTLAFGALWFFSR